MGCGGLEATGRAPTATDFLFPDQQGQPFREKSSRLFLSQITLVDGEIEHRGHTLDVYGLRHSFATVARRAGIPGDARDRLLGHRPKDVKAMHYEDEDLPLLATEIAKIPPLLDLPSPGDEAARDQAPERLSNPQKLAGALSASGRIPLLP